MNLSTPHYLLFSQVHREDGSGRWRFTLRTADGAELLEAADVEPRVRGERLELLTVVRALEALDRPARVTVVGCSTSLRRGMQYGLGLWRENGWRWEFFGQMVPVKNGDLWQRMDRALKFHHVECRQHRFDPPHHVRVNPCPNRDDKHIHSATAFALRRRLWRWVLLRWAYGRRRGSALLRLWRRRGTALWLVRKFLARRSVCELPWH